MSYPGRRRRKYRFRRRIRRGFAALAVVLILAFSARFASLVHSAWIAHLNRNRIDTSAWARTDTSRALAVMATETAAGPIVVPRRVVYPYSIIPGGINSTQELQRLSDHDPVVGLHYAGFDFQHARIFELDQPRLVYLSYRLGDRVFWTRKKITLHKGEKLISDGKVTARARCANRVSEAAQPQVSAEEPPAGKFEEPLLQGGTATEVPFPQAGNLFAIGPTPPPGAPGLAPPTGFGLPPLFPPPIPPQACVPAKTTGHGEEVADLKATKGKPCSPGTPPPAVPEPATALLVSSGILGVYLRRHHAKS